MSLRNARCNDKDADPCSICLPDSTCVNSVIQRCETGNLIIIYNIFVATLSCFITFCRQFCNQSYVFFANLCHSLLHSVSALRVTSVSLLPQNFVQLRMLFADKTHLWFLTFRWPCILTDSYNKTN